MNWKPVEINGAKLEIRDRGSGEPIVFVHGSMGDELVAVLEEPALANHFRLVDYHRRGYGGSERALGPVSNAQQSADCRAIIRLLGIQRAHFAGQSYGGVIVLQVVMDAPEAVHSLALLEPALPSVMLNSADLGPVFANVGALYGAGDKAGAIDTFARAVAGPDYQEAFNRSLPKGWFARWVADADTAMTSDNSDEGWDFTAADAARVTQPVLNLRGANTISDFQRIHERMRALFPQTESCVLPDATHAMTQTNPRGAAERLAQFFTKHPL